MGKMYTLALAKGLTLYGLDFSDTSFPFKDNCVAICCAISMGGKGAEGEDGMDDKGDVEGGYEGNGMGGDICLGWG